MLTPRMLQIKDLPSIIDCEPIILFKKLFSQSLPSLGVKGILLPLARNTVEETYVTVLFDI